MKDPQFTLQDIEYSVDKPMFLRAQKLWETGKVQNVSETSHGYTAIVQGTSPYEVSLSRKHIDQGYCDCYMGQRDELCKHLLALGITVLHLSGKMKEQGEASPTDLDEVKQLVAKGLRKIKPYTGPSKTWFTYQRSLDVGSGIIQVAVRNLPPNADNAKYLWDLVLKMSLKLSQGGVDDSNGTVGYCITALVEQCGNYAKRNPELKPLIQVFTNDDTGFGFERDLITFMIS